MPGHHKIALNGFGSIGRLMMQTMPILSYAPEPERRAMQNMIDEAQRRDTLEAERKKHELFCNPPSHTLHHDPYQPHTFTFHLPESAVTDVRVDDAPVINDRYWNRQFPKDYAKKKKAKRRQQNQSRRHR